MNAMYGSHIPQHLRITRIDPHTDPSKLFVYDVHGDYLGWFPFEVSALTAEFDCSEDELYHYIGKHDRVGNFYLSKFRVKNLSKVDAEQLHSDPDGIMDRVEVLYKAGVSLTVLGKTFRMSKTKISSAMKKRRDQKKLGD